LRDQKELIAFWCLFINVTCLTSLLIAEKRQLILETDRDVVKHVVG